MFNDRYGLTQAVLEGRKTMTRRIIKGEFEKVTAYHANGGLCFLADTKDGETIILEPQYLECENVAVAQRYKDVIRIANSDESVWQFLVEKDLMQSGGVIDIRLCTCAGYDNKMFVVARFMPHRIRITNLKVERLQDISDEDCIKEGIEYDSAEGSRLWWYDIPDCQDVKLKNTLMRHEWYGQTGCWFWDTPQGAFSALIDCIIGKGTWERNPWVFAYEFELIK